MPESYFNAYSRLQTLLRKFNQDTVYADRYRQEINKLFINGYARELRDDELPSKHVWYLPHFGVLNPNKPSKLRLVYDAAAKVNDVSLNDYLLTGPDLYNSLFGIMTRFREKSIVIIGDIRDMFLRIKVRSEDQHVLRFLWQESKDSPIKVCAMQSFIFGATCSPFIAQYIENKNALKCDDVHSEAVEVIINNHYMDDCLYSVSDENKAIQLVHEITEIHRKGGFKIRGWSSNSKPVLDSIPTDALARTAIQFKDGVNNTTERTLGLIWHPADDTFGFQINLSRIPIDILDGSTSPTKAKMLSIIMSIYDIHGFLSPFVIESKIILQDVHRSNINWTCQILPAEHNKFIKWLDELKQLELLRIPRWYLKAGIWTQCYSPTVGSYDTNTIVNKEMHVFCDASIKSYACVIFWRLTRADGNVLVCFAAAKSRVTPLRLVSIPRLELQGALIALRLADTLLREQKDMKPHKRYFWTDSHTVLQWIRSDPRSYKPFVAHRLGEIDELTVTSEWRYVPTKLNVADIATKEESLPLTYDSVWFQEPGFLRQPEETWPKDLKSEKTSQEAVCESRSVNIVMTSHAIEYSLPNENNFSSWTRLVRSTARVLLFIKRCRRLEVQFNVELLNEAEKLLLKKSQYDIFAQEIEQLKQNKPLLSTSRLLTLTPYLDSDGILRVQGRVDKVQCVERSTMRPIILDGHHQMTRLLVEYYHRKALHGAHDYWILKLRPTVRAVASRCLFCRHRRAAPQPQRMADLPAARLQHHRRPFTFTGIDFFGPMEVTVGRKRQKRYGVIFTCLTIRAIHLELTESLTTDSAIMALRRMIARRATPNVIFSDNGTNLRGADNELKRSVSELDHSKLREDGTTRGIEWKFIPPGAPEMGGAWERMIRTVKTALKVVLKERASQPETLSTLITEVEAIVNSRPITYVSCDPTYPEALTPNHFLIGTSSNGPTLGRYNNDDLCLRKQWRIAQRLADMFWGRWLKEYLPTLLPRYKWNKDQRALRDGDFVLLIEPNLDRGSWRHGVVSGTHGGDDGRIRVVDVRTRTGMVRRPVTRVALLEPATDYDSETTERKENLTDSNQDNSECTTPTASHDNIAAELAYDQPDPEPLPEVVKPTHIDTVARKISTASSIGSNQSDGGSMAPERSGSTESQNGEKKQQKPSRKISRFLVSPVVDRGENVPEEKLPPEEPQTPAVNGLDKDITPQPQEFVPTHQYSVPSQTPAIDHRPEMPGPKIELRPEIQTERPIEQMQEIPPTVTIPITAPIVSNIQSIPQIPVQVINPNLINASLQPNLTTPLQIATDSPLLGLSQVGTPMGVGNELLNIGLGHVGGSLDPTVTLGLSTQQTLTPIPGVPDALPNAENIQRMLLKQNIMNQQQNLSGPNLLGLLNQQAYPQPDLTLHNTLLNNAQPSPPMMGRLPPQYPQQKYYQPMRPTANDFIAQQQALQSSVNQLANQQMNQLGIMGLAAPLPAPNMFQHQTMAQNLALNQNLMGQNLGQNLGLATQNLGLAGQNLIGGQNLGLGGQNLALGGQNLAIMNQNLGQLVAHRAVHHALARRAVDIDMAGMANVNSTGSSQPSTPNKSQSYNEYMLSLQHKLASISNSGPVSPESPLEYSPALSPTHRPPLHNMPKSEANEVPTGAAPPARGHAAALAELDHELSKISLHYKQPPAKHSHDSTPDHDNMQAATNYTELAPEWESRSTRFRVSRAAPCRGYELCRLMPTEHGKDKLDMLSQSHPYAEGALDSVSLADNTSMYSEGAGGGSGETYVITDARPRVGDHTYLVHDALADVVATIIDPNGPNAQGGEVVSVTEELSRWKLIESGDSGPWREGSTVPPSSDMSERSELSELRALRHRSRELAADVLLTEHLTDKVLYRQVVLVSVAPAPTQL